MTDQEDNVEQSDLDPSHTNDESTVADMAADSPESVEALDPTKSPKKHRSKIGWAAAFILLFAVVAACFGGYQLNKEHRLMRAQMAGFATSAEIAEQAVLLAEQNLVTEQNKELVKVQSQKIQELENRLAAVQKEQQRSITQLGQEQQRLAARVEKSRQALQGGGESFLKSEIETLIRMAQDQLELNHNATRARQMLASAADRIKRVFHTNLDSLSNAIQADIVHLEQFRTVDRAAILERLEELESALLRAQLKVAPAVTRLSSPTEPLHSVVDLPEDQAANSQSLGFKQRMTKGWDVFTSHLGGYIRIHRHAPKPVPLPEPLDIKRLQLELRQWFGIARVSLFTNEPNVFGQSIQAILDLLRDNFDIESADLKKQYDDLRALGNDVLQAYPNDKLKAAQVLQELLDPRSSTVEVQAAGAED